MQLVQEMDDDEEMDDDLEEDEHFSEFDSGDIIDPNFMFTLGGQKAMVAMPSAPPDILSFAQWAFGPSGLPDLQVLAYSDFFHEGRYKWQNLLFCKSEFGYELAKRGHSLGLEATLNQA
jgi:hypothetical protein